MNKTSKSNMKPTIIQAPVKRSRKVDALLTPDEFGALEKKRASNPRNPTRSDYLRLLVRRDLGLV